MEHWNKYEDEVNLENLWNQGIMGNLWPFSVKKRIFLI